MTWGEGLTLYRGCSQACERLLTVCVCHAFGIVMSFHVSPSHQFSFKPLASGGGQAVRCHGDGSVTALAALHLTNGLLLSLREEPCSGANASLL